MSIISQISQQSKCKIFICFLRFSFKVAPNDFTLNSENKVERTAGKKNLEKLALLRCLTLKTHCAKRRQQKAWKAGKEKHRHRRGKLLFKVKAKS